jgi:nicotinamidase-related amidase
MSQAALLIIDMQKGMASREAGPRNNPQAEANIAKLLQAWRDKNWPIIHVRHMSRTPDSPFWPGQVNNEFQPAFAPLPQEHVVEKNIPCAFTQSGLERYGRPRSAAEVHAMALANLDGEYAQIAHTEQVLHAPI